MNLLTHSILSLLLIGFSFDCSHEKKIRTDANSNDVFIYNYRGPSVAPQYRRDYTIRVRPDQVNLSIDSYGELLYSDSTTLSASAYKSFVRSLSDLHLEKKEYKPGAAMCTGGVSDNLVLYAGADKELKGFIYYCGGNKDGDLEGDVATAAALFKALVPELAKKIEATKKN